jgi:hypothetical protein
MKISDELAGQYSLMAEPVAACMAYSPIVAELVHVSFPWLNIEFQEN